MAATYLKISKTVPGGSAYSTVKITGDSSYVTGGYPIDSTQIGLPANQIKSVIDVRPANAASCQWTPVMIEVTDGRTITSLKLMLVVTSTFTEVAAAANVSTAAYNVILAGN